MKNNYLNRELRLKADINELNKLEDFIEQICDDFHVYDSYFGNIVASNNLALEICSACNNEKNFYFDIYFKKKPTGMFFTLKVYDCFLDFAKQYEIVKEKSTDAPDAFNGYWHRMMMLRMLSDEIIIDPAEETFTMVFHVTGINEALTNQRIELLQKYYEKLQVGVKQ